MTDDKRKLKPDSRLPISRMALRLVPYAMRPEPEERAEDESSPVVVNYAANLDPLPEGTDVSDLPEPPVATLPGAALPSLVIEITVQPMVVNDDNGNEVLTFALDARLPAELGSHELQSEPEDPLSTWAHDLKSDAVDDCVSRVRNAAPEDRYQRLLDLADAMMAPLEPTR